MSILPIVLALSAPAVGGEWWWVQGDPQDAVMTFADSESVVRDGARARVRTVTIDRSGQAVIQHLTFACPASDREGARRFACDTAEDRMNWAAMLGPMSPSEAARAIFSSVESGGTGVRAD